MTEMAKTITKQWAEQFVERYGTVRDAQHLRELVELLKKDGRTLDRVFAAMAIDLLATAVVHHTSKHVAKDKVREVSHLAAMPITRREYWNKVDRLHHFVAGVVALKQELEDDEFDPREMRTADEARPS